MRQKFIDIICSEGRFTELISGVGLLWASLILTTWPQALEVQGYNHMARMLDPYQWAVVFGICGTIQVGALVHDIRKPRNIMAAISAAIWAVMALERFEEYKLTAGALGIMATILFWIYLRGAWPKWTRR